MMNTILPHIDDSWTLFLDRDGVINKRIVDVYISQWVDFEFVDGVLEAFPMLSSKFGRIVVVTNQQGIGKGLVTSAQVDDVHSRMIAEVERHGGLIDSVIVCGQQASDSENFRKPNPKMAFMVKQAFPEIDFSKSIMVGDSESDVLFGKNAGMVTVKVAGHNDIADYNFDTLKDFSTHIR